VSAALRFSGKWSLIDAGKTVPARRDFDIRIKRRKPVMNTITTTGFSKSRKLMLGVSIVLGLMSLASSTTFAQDTWDHTNAPRFQLLAPLASQAVLDRETGIVWVRSPSAAGFTWDQAHKRCNTLVVGNRMGWRLPTLQELTSVLSYGSPNNLETGHPFNLFPQWSNGQMIWSGTTSAVNTNQAWTMNLASTLFPAGKNTLSLCWCVRFRQGVDPQ
jgi:hypothetical protein